MIITKKLEIIVKNNMRKYYTELGYEVPSYFDPKIIIDIIDLPKNSNVKIDCECDICGKINNISYYHYNKNIKIEGFYSCRGKCSRIKFRTTCINKFNCENPFQDENVKSKIKNTLNTKYGVDNSMKLEETKNKSKTTCLKHYGTDSYFKTKEIKEKVKEKFGVENVFQNEDIKKKIKENYKIKYNVDYLSQVESIHIKQQKNGFKYKIFKNTDLYYRGSYELDFLEKYYNKIKIKNGKVIKYRDNKIYFPDFYCDELNLLIEIKSDYYFNKYLEKNLDKQKACLEQGYRHIFLINKNYNELNEILEI